MSVVDDRLRTLTDDGQLKRLMRGVYELVTVFAPPRVISKTILEDGSVKYDIGDEVWTLTPSEDRRLAELSIGAAQAAAMAHSTKEYMYLATKLAARVDQQQRVIDALRNKRTNERQQLLFAAHSIRTGSDLKNWALLKGYTGDDAALALGVPRSTYDKYLTMDELPEAVTQTAECSA